MSVGIVCMVLRKWKLIFIDSLDFSVINVVVTFVGIKPEKQENRISLRFNKNYADLARVKEYKKKNILVCLL